MSDAQAIFAPDAAEALAKGLFAEDVALAVSFPWEAPTGLLPQEMAGIGQPGPKRLAEFAAGRRAAHDAMERLGAPVGPVWHGTDRAPVWPTGLVGSLSHNDVICISVMGYTKDYAALALDIEEDADLPSDLWAEVCTQMELAWLSVQHADIRGRLARLIFSAKECAYKLQYPVTRTLLEFDAFEITPDLETGQFEATLTQDVTPFRARSHFSGRFAFGAGLLLTGMAIPHANNA